MIAAMPPVPTIEAFGQQSDEYKVAVRKIVRSHAINELYGRPGVRRAGDRAGADTLCQMADLPDRNGGVRPSRPLQGAGRTDRHHRR